MQSRFKRIAIVGLPGAGKSTIARALLVECRVKDNHLVRKNDIAYIHGDELLPANLISVCSVVPCFVAEHMCLAQLLEHACKKNVVDLIVYLKITIAECERRLVSRNGHTVETEVSLKQLDAEIAESVLALYKSGIKVNVLSEKDEQYIIDNNIVGDKLWRYIETTAKDFGNGWEL